jgi:hypothetical protein
LAVELRVSAELAREIARFRRLDFDHLDADHGQLAAAERAGEDVGRAEHPHAFEQPGHFRSSDRAGLA